MLYSLKNVTCRYLETPGIAALDCVDLEIAGNEYAALIGPIGAGKSTLLKLLIGLLKPVSGAILYQGGRFPDSGTELRNLRKNTGIAFQFADNQIFEATVRREIAFGLENFAFPAEEIPRLTEEALSLFGLNPDLFGERPPFDLSAGERKRLTLASIFALRPQFLLLDEPVSGLDGNGIMVLKEALQANRRGGGGALIVTHNLDFAAEMCPRVIILQQGKKLFDGDRSVYYDEGIMTAAGLEPPEIVEAWKEMQENNPTLPSKVFSLQEAALNLKQDSPKEIL